MCVSPCAVHHQALQCISFQRYFSQTLETSLVTPIPKNGCRDVLDPNKSYRPISNLTVLSKLLEKLNWPLVKTGSSLPPCNRHTDKTTRRKRQLSNCLRMCYSQWTKGMCALCLLISHPPSTQLIMLSSRKGSELLSASQTLR